MRMRNVFHPSLTDTYLTAKLSFRGTNMAKVMRKHFVTLKGLLVKKNYLLPFWLHKGSVIVQKRAKKT